MKILGIHDGHNSSACLLIDGKVEYCIQEERLTGRKNFIGFPEKSIQLILRSFDLHPEEIDKVALSSYYMMMPRDDNQLLERFRDSRNYFSLFKRMITHNRLFGKYADRATLKPRLKRFNGLGFSTEQIEVVEHHTGHASAAYFGSSESFRKPYLVLTLDGAGDGLCSTVSVAEGGSLNRIASTPSGDSLGHIYSRLTFMMGFMPWEHEYKLMGMAPYVPKDRAEQASQIFKRYLALDPENKMVFKRHIPTPTSHILRRLKQDLDRLRFDEICAGLQLFTEDLMAEWVTECIRETGIPDILCAGGVFMNV